ncbi:hypothetical protein B277_05768 [Janibacter hoylei PVAS-1]|uniref:Peptidase C39-like domain-containing protein n=1 Tax=Janibacter hoylei PVAS-1 TaxID=1210046 RepID=K1DZ55_9MICO|nr:hypothetical protein [Janibacter hoylei]EKA61654.1 hypothetical protein B277_05768 [Janibacter hoylei PVAS-1]
MSAPYRLVQGSSGPRQQSPTTCGSACATVARMLVDAPFARWITAGEGQPVPGAEGSTQAERFAAWERTVHARTNGWRGSSGTLALGWPRALGTPPWGLRRELEQGASRVGTRYRLVSVRGHSEESLRARYRRLLDLVVDGEPAALYVGSRLLPRHVTLVLPGQRADALDVYEPASGSVQLLDEDAFARRRLRLGGWSVPWILVQPTGHRRVVDGSPATSPWRVPRLAPEPSPDLLREADPDSV